ncbi:hypothetical protein L6452_42731 [Arctium lappa]|uniref:Uncharacterized protein n=1 Tax=Arctium lappa TaxID=4217 RepID=A0ACB8XJB3_ARCLA|nr:hypothetical protein L6452_42731 [Arctium lappa]
MPKTQTKSITRRNQYDLETLTMIIEVQVCESTKLPVKYLTATRFPFTSARIPKPHWSSSLLLHKCENFTTFLPSPSPPPPPPPSGGCG